jgi:hypothetical protein
MENITFRGNCSHRSNKYSLLRIKYYLLESLMRNSWIDSFLVEWEKIYKRNLKQLVRKTKRNINTVK